MDWKIIAIGGAALLLVGMLVFMLAGAEAKGCELQIPEGYVYGIGEGVSKDLNEARAIALENALSELSNKLITYVESDKELSRFVMVEEAGGEREKLSEEKLRVRINIKSAIQIGRYKQAECSWESDGKKHVKIAVYIHPTYAKALVQAYAYAAVLKRAAQNRLCFTGYEFAQKLKTLSAAIIPTPAPVAESSFYIKEVEGCQQRAMAIISKMESLKLETPDDFMEYASLYAQLKEITAEIPNAQEIVKRLGSSKAPSLHIEGPEYVVKNQEVLLKVSLTPAPKGTYQMSVFSRGLEAPGSVSVSRGRASVRVKVVGEEANFELNLADVIHASWKPKRVYESDLEGVVKALLSLAKAPKEKVVFLPASWSEPDITAAALAQKDAIALGWNVADAGELSRCFDQMIADAPEGFKIAPAKAVYVHVENGKGELSGALSAVVESETFRPQVKERASADSFAKAAIVTGNFQALEGIKDEFFKGVASLVKGDLDGARRYLEKATTALSRLLLARVLYQMGDYKAAAEEALKAKEQYPQRAFMTLADSLAKISDPMYLLGKMREIKQATLAIKDCHACYYAGATLLYSFGNSEEAKEWILKALDIKPDDPSYLLLYAQILADLGEKEEARAVVEKLQKMNLKPSQREKLKELKEKLK